MVLVALVILPQTDIAKTFLLEQTEQLIGQDIQVKKIDLTLFPSPHLQLVDVEIKNLNPDLEYLKAQLFDVEILLLPLFYRTVVVKRLILERPEVIIRLLKKKKKLYSGVQKCLNLCGLVEFAKYKPNLELLGVIISTNLSG